jgi:curli biogenesis system outer membrane secretion channel CsgG
MRRSILFAACAALLLGAASPTLSDEKSEKKEGKKDEKKAAVYPTALFVFEERGAGAREMGQKVTDLLFAKLVVKDNLTLVDREDLKKTLGEAELNLSGAVKPAEATKVGQLTGAKILVTGSVIHSDKKLFLVAKVIGTETTRVVGASVDGKATDELDVLVDKLADKVAEVIAVKSDDLVAKVVPKGDRIAALKEKLKKGGQKPTVMVKVTEKHIGAVTIDPAAQTEFLLILKECGFEVIDAEEGQKTKADVIISGEGLSTFASRRGNLMTVTARLEIKAVERTTDRVLAADRQTVVVVELTEALAGKSALQEAAADIAERLIPKLVKEEKKP